MAVPHHDPIEFTAGDDWDIGGTLLRPDGTAYDLTNASVIWMLRGPDGDPALQDDQYAIKFSCSILTATWRMLGAATRPRRNTRV